MKKLISTLLCTAMVALAGLYYYQMQNQDVVTNAPMNEQVAQSLELVSIPIPARLTSPEVTSVYSQTEHVEIEGKAHPVYFEFDQNENLYYVGSSEELVALLSYLPAEVVFEVFENAEVNDINKVKAGEHADCMAECNTLYTKNGKRQKGRGSCRTTCWVDTIVGILPIIVGVLVR